MKYIILISIILFSCTKKCKVCTTHTVQKYAGKVVSESDDKFQDCNNESHPDNSYTTSNGGVHYYYTQHTTCN